MDIYFWERRVIRRDGATAPRRGRRIWRVRWALLIPHALDDICLVARAGNVHFNKVALSQLQPLYTVSSDGIYGAIIETNSITRIIATNDLQACRWMVRWGSTVEVCKY